MGVLIEFLIDRGIVDAEIGAEVDDFNASRQQIVRNLRGNAVWQGKKGDLYTRGGNGIGIGRDEREFASG